MKIVLASSNPGKLREVREVLEPLGFLVLPQSAFAVPPVEETAPTFLENALLKARNAARYSGLPALGDDSGLEVELLGGAPGVYSARYAGPRATDQENNRKLLEALAPFPELEMRRARFRCLLAFLRHPFDPAPIVAEASWEGAIALSPRGEGGFGYDPIFYLPQLDRTAAELSPEEKSRLSHRGKALRLLAEKLKGIKE